MLTLEEVRVLIRTGEVPIGERFTILHEGVERVCFVEEEEYSCGAECCGYKHTIIVE